MHITARTSSDECEILEPKEEPKPQPIGYMPMVILFTTCMLCALFLLWRRADTLRRVVAHQSVSSLYDLLSWFHLALILPED